MAAPPTPSFCSSSGPHTFLSQFGSLNPLLHFCCLFSPIFLDSISSLELAKQQKLHNAGSFLGRKRIPNFQHKRVSYVAHCTSKNHTEPTEQSGNLPRVHSLKPDQLSSCSRLWNPHCLCTERLRPSASPAHLLRQHPPTAKWQDLNAATSSAALIIQGQPCRVQSYCWGMQRKPTGTRFTK